MITLLFPLLLSAPTAPVAPPIYAADDPLIQMKQQVERLMGVYLVKPPRRHASERIQVRGGQVRIDVWHPVAGLSDAELKTRAVEWFVFGRTQYAPGVGGIFSEMPGVREAILVFHDVTRPSRKGRRRSTRPDQIKKYLAIKLTRKKFDRLNMRVMRQCIAQGDCSLPFRADFTKSSFDKRYTAAKRSEE